jgi:peptidyl-prolyl cis-trans isomerase D
MSVISTIRQRSGLAVSIVAVGLILFLVGGDILGPNSLIMGNRSQKIGEINGETISATDFQNELKQVEADYFAQNQKSPSETEMTQLRDQAWNQLIFAKLYKPQIEKLGIEVSEDEAVDMVQGNFIHPAIRQAFTDPQTQQFNKEGIKNFLANFSRAQPQQQAAWLSFERKLPEDRLRTKYEALLNKTDYVTTLQAKREYQASMAKVDVKYLFINYNTVPDSTIKPTDQELADYLKAHTSRYKSQENRALEYVDFKVMPSAEDSTAIATELTRIKGDFQTAENDTIYAASVSETPVALKQYTVNELPAELSNMASSLQAGTVYGPFPSNANYTLYKVVSIGNEGPFNVKASHILFKPAATNDSGKAAAKASAQKILDEIKGGASFEDRARQYGSDGTAQQGGDLGWFGEGRMVPQFEKAVFGFNGAGLLPNLIETDFGYHIIKVTQPKTNFKYKIVTVQRSLTPGDKAREAMFARASQFKVNATDKDAFAAAITKEGIAKQTALNVNKASASINDISDGREITRWAYNEETKVNDISQVYELNDRYVVAILTKKTQEGTADVEEVRAALTTEVIKQKKFEAMREKIGKGSVQDMVAKYNGSGAGGAIVNEAKGLLLSQVAIMHIGYDPEAVGRAHGLKKGASSAPFKGESGLVVIQLDEAIPAPSVDKTTDLKSFKAQIESKNQQRNSYSVGEALKEVGKVVDNRIRFF